MKWVLFILVFLSGCTIRPPVSIYHPVSEENAVQAWSDAFNKDDAVSLRQLVHPLKKGVFDKERPRVREWLETRLVKSYLIGPKVSVNETLAGRKVTLHYHDGRAQYDKEVLVVKGEERWWVWSF